MYLEAAGPEIPLFFARESIAPLLRHCAIPLCHEERGEVARRVDMEWEVRPWIIRNKGP